ncbi:MAG: MotA/TolQ/ExbB proton channel family protein [Pirellulales bacterium]|nr:MotA/TolQ/ExbB proton channel family protein [Pirellulales bacterium]
MTWSTKLWRAIAKSPILWGGVTSAAFYGLVRSGVLAGPFIQRYFNSHLVEYLATTMFCIGLAALALKLIDILGQYPLLSASLLGPIPRGGQGANACDSLLDRLARLPRRRQGDYLVLRLHKAIEHVRRRGSAETLDEHLQYLADLDAGRLHASYSLVRVIIWAIPILGFLGTVIGITLAIANLAPEALEDSLPEVTAGLGVAFDTTALALGLSIVLMFAQFLTDRAESTLLAQVDDQAAAELEGRFEQVSAGPDGQLAAVRRMAETVVEVTERLVQRQAELWQASMNEAGKRWSTLADAAGKQVQATLAGALSESLKGHVGQLAAVEQSLAEQNRRHWQQVQQTQTHSVRAMASLQEAISRQGDVLGRAVEATGEVVKLETALNRNLSALAGASNFEQTVMSLAAVIHLLNARLAGSPSDAPPIQLDAKPRTTQAA